MLRLSPQAPNRHGSKEELIAIFVDIEPKGLACQQRRSVQS